ncbi:hypothetical protein ABZ297_14650 [Nonomuraea sp. NPDC005983]|uniref:hypothetical protein n=1 Tax=Nonomuraea sp. NPDC005983 TaxID=3155595 RepID=UPI0033AFCED9
MSSTSWAATPRPRRWGARTCPPSPDLAGDAYLIDLKPREDGYQATQLHGYWKIDDLLECHRVLMEQRRGELRGSVDARSRLYGEVVVEPGAEIIDSIITGPAVIGAGTLVRDSRIGPYTALGSGCTLVNAGIEHSITLDGVSVLSVRGIYGSLIGREAAVCSAADDDHRRLAIGDHATVEVA